MFQEAVNQAMHQATINQSGLFMNTVRNVIRDAMSGSLMQEQTTGPVYINTDSSAVGTSKRPMSILEAPSVPKLVSGQPAAIQTPSLIPSSQPVVFLINR
jgi:hypothetical protein